MVTMNSNYSGRGCPWAEYVRQGDRLICIKVNNKATCLTIGKVYEMALDKVRGNPPKWAYVSVRNDKGNLARYSASCFGFIVPEGREKRPKEVRKKPTLFSMPGQWVWTPVSDQVKPISPPIELGQRKLK